MSTTVTLARFKDILWEYNNDPHKFKLHAMDYFTELLPDLKKLYRADAGGSDAGVTDAVGDDNAEDEAEFEGEHAPQEAPETKAPVKPPARPGSTPPPYKKR